MAGTTVIVSYNPVLDFPAGWYGNGRLCVRAGDKRSGAYSGPPEAGPDANAAIALCTICQEEFPTEGVERFIVYVGLHGYETAIGLALSLHEKYPEKAVTVVSCGCQWKETEQKLAGTGISMIRSECGGREKLGEMAREILAEP